MTEHLTFSRRAALAIIGGAAMATAVPAFAQDAAVVEEMSIGAEDAPITMIEYASFTCPHCANFHTDVYGQIKENYIDTGKVRMIYRAVYFSGDRPSLWADLLAHCGGKDRYFGLVKMIYEKQREWTAHQNALAMVDSLYSIGKLAGLEQSDMEVCMQNNDLARALVTASAEGMETHGINSTPTFVINDEVVSNMAYSGFVEIFDKILAE